MHDLKILILLCAANGAPILLDNLLGKRYALPVDGGLLLGDGRSILGASKTWRGLASSLLLTPLIAWMLDFSATTGLLFAAAAMFGDLCSSFLKRRLAIPASGMALGLDQIPESLFPLLLLSKEWSLSIGDIFILVATFLVLELVLSRILYRLHLRKQPY